MVAVAAFPPTHTHPHARTHNRLWPFGIGTFAHCGRSSLWSAAAIESERGNRHIFFHVARTRRGDANGISMGLEPRSESGESERTGGSGVGEEEGRIYEVELKPTHL